MEGWRNGGKGRDSWRNGGNREEGWRNGGNRGRSVRHGDQGAAKDCTTFFFSNFPSDYGELDMFKVFQKWARVKEVFISRRLNKWGRRFGFVRFFGVRNVGRLERDLDQLYVGDRKMFVNVPKYPKQQSEPSRMEQRVPRESNRERKDETWKQDQQDTELSRKQRREEKWVEKSGNRSYAEVVTGDSQEQWKGLTIKVQQLIMLWMERSVVGKLRDDVDVDQLGEEVVQGSMNMVQVRLLGDNLVLLTPRAGENMEDIIKHYKE